MKKLFIILIVVLALLGATLLGAWWWLTTSRSGAEWMLNRAAGVVPSLRWESLQGGLAGGVVLRDVRLNEADTPIQIDRLELAARVSLLPSPSVDVQWLRASDVRIDLPVADPRDPDAPPFEMPDISSPVPVRIGELRLENVELHFADPESEPLMIERVDMAGHYHDRLELDHLNVRLADSEIDASGHWQLKSPFGGELALTARHRIDEDTLQTVQAQLSGRLAALNIELETSGPAELQGQVRLRDLPQALDANISLEGRLGDWPGLDYAAEELTLNASGGPDAWQARIDTRIAGPEIPPNRIRTTLSGSTEAIDIEELLAEVLDGEIELVGQARFSPELAADLDIRLRQLDLTELYPEWPEQARIQGGLRLAADAERIQFDELSLSAPPTSLSLSGSGHFEPAADRVALDLNWQDLNWPPVIDDSEPLFSSQSGRVRLTGALSAWQLELETVLQTLNQPPASLEARAQGDDSQARIESLRLDAGSMGRLEASGQVHWAPELRGSLALAMEDVDPGLLMDQLPGQVSSSLALDFHGSSDLALTVDEISGQLRGQPLGGAGQITISEEQPEAGSLNLSLGDNRFRIDSRDGRAWSWQLQAQAMQQLWPDLSGEADLSGSFNPFEQTLTASGSLRASGYGDITMDRAELDIDLGWAEPTRTELSLTVHDLDLNPWERITILELDLVGSCREHGFSLNLDGQRGSLELAGRGALPDCLRGGETWAGTLERLYLAETVAGDWELNQALELQAGPGRITARPACLVESATREGRICLRSLVVGEQSRLEAGIEQVPMDLILLPLDPIFNLTTPLSGEMSAEWNATDGIKTAAGFLALGSGAIRPLGEDQDLLFIESVRVGLTPGAEGFVLDLNAVLEGDSRLQGQALLVDLNDLDSAIIEAEAQLDLPDIGAFNRLVAELDQLSGQLQAELQIAGPLLAPDVQGEARLSQGLVVHAPLGLKISDIEIEVRGENDQGQITGRMLSGDGHLNVNGQMARDDNRWTFEINAEGEDFAFADVDWLQLQASPRIQLKTSDGIIDLDGDIHIDRLRAGMPPGTEERVTVSNDVEVIGETDDDEDREAPPFRGRLGIHLGDNSSLSATGLQTELAGGIELHWRPQSPMPRGRGVIRLPSGAYRAYGQNLEISDGQIIFTGHPLDDPRLDIRAIRDIFGDPVVDEAGVHIRGNARNPEISLFTEPPTSEAKALAYIVTGADFDHAGGQGAVSLGFYLLPRLFVSYGIGLFETGNVLSGRYELSQRWGVRVVSGERDTGVDISFAVDR